jgi:hypothetical protein
VSTPCSHAHTVVRHTRTSLTIDEAIWLGRGAQEKKIDGVPHVLALQLLVSVIGSNCLVIEANEKEDLVVHSKEGGAIVAEGNVLPGLSHTVRSPTAAVSL